MAPMSAKSFELYIGVLNIRSVAEHWQNSIIGKTLAKFHQDSFAQQPLTLKKVGVKQVIGRKGCRNIPELEELEELVGTLQELILVFACENLKLLVKTTCCKLD
jgi:hypothetical protein